MNFHAIMGTLGKQMQAAGPSVLVIFPGPSNFNVRRSSNLPYTVNSGTGGHWKHLWAYGKGQSWDRGVLLGRPQSDFRFHGGSRVIPCPQSVYIGISHGIHPHWLSRQESKNAEGWTPLIWHDPESSETTTVTTAVFDAHVTRKNYSNQTDLASPA